MNKILFFLALFIAAFFVKQSVAQLEHPVPFDPAVRYGVLDNGLTYYIRHNQEPKERASFYIIQNVGALLEDDNQNGLAHFLEHMAFNGTKHFEGKGILNTLEKHGVAFGRNINAGTSFEETVYNLSDVPTTHEGLIDTCLLILHDWSDYLLLTEQEIDMERGVITEEWRTRRNSSIRLREQWFPVVFKGSKYAVRDVIGDTTVIRYHKPETLRSFYHDWYRTDLQAIAIVGDIDVDAVEQKVKTLFSKIATVENKKERPSFDIPYHEETYFVCATDKEASQSSISVYIPFKNNDGKEKSLGDMRDMLMQNLYNSITSMRIQELLQKGTPPFVNGSTQVGGFVRGYNAYFISTTAKPNEEARALETIMIETERLRRHGVTNSEMERVKTNYLTSLESQVKQKDKIRNDSYCREYRQHYLTKEPSPGIEFEYDFAKQIFPTITAEEISAKAKQWIQKGNRSVVITGPSEGVTHLTKEEAFAILDKVEKMDIAPYTEETAATSLINEPLKGAKIKKTKKLPEFNAVEWTLANNVKVIFRKADYEKDNVSLHAFSPGGTSLFDNEYVPSFNMMPNLIGNYGVGDFDAITLQKMLTGKKVSISPSFGDISEGVNGSSTPKDFETLMQLVYLGFEKPRFDAEAHNALMARYMAYVANMEKDPRKIMSDSLNNILYNYNPRIRNLNTQFLQEVSLEQIEKIYRDRIQDAGDFTFFIVGNIEEETVKPMVEKYLGSLKDSKRTEKWIDRKVTNAQGLTKKQIEIPLTTPKANINIFFFNDIAYTPKTNLQIQLLDAILDLRYTETVREEEGGTYGVSVRGGISKFPREEASLSINFDCDPLRAETLKAIIYREIEKIKQEGPTEVDLDKTIKNLLKDREQSREHNNFWMSSLSNYYHLGINFADTANYEEVLKKMTKEEMKAFANTFFNNADNLDIVFLPSAN